MTEWKILNLRSKKENGCVDQISYQCTVSDSDSGLTARKIGVVSIEGDVNDEGFIPYNSIMESDALNWLFEELGSEKATIETETSLKVSERIAKRAAREYTTGTPW